MKNILHGHLVAEDLSLAVVASRFNELIVNRLVSGAEDAFLRHGGDQKNLTLCWVPGSFEIPFAVKKMAHSQKKHYDAIVCLGAVIRGNTPHFDYVAGETAKGIARLSLELSIPIIFGVLTTDTLEQAIERAGTKMGNKGYDSVCNAIEMINLMKCL